ATPPPSHPFPTRRSSDLSKTKPLARFQRKLVFIGSTGTGRNIADLGATPLENVAPLIMEHFNIANSILMNRFIRRSSYPAETGRSEEHTSELQSLRHLVC